MISIIVPIRNEKKFISSCLDSIIKQSVNEPAEILISDGMSTDGTREIIKKYQKNNSSIHIVDNPEKIVSTGFNRALSIARGKVIIRVDGHAIVKSNYIDQCLKVLKKTNADCVGGPILNSSDGIIGKSINIAQKLKFGVGGVAFRGKIKKGQFVDTLAFGAYKRDVFKRLGGYDQELKKNQDDEFNYRLIQEKGKIWLDPSIQSIYFPRKSIFKLLSQYFLYGLYKVRVMQKRRGLAALRHIIPLLFVLSLFGSIFYFIKYNIIVPFLIISLPYISISILSSFNQLIKNLKNWRSTLILPLVFFTMHFAYGFGYLLGLCLFIFKWNDTEIKDSYFDKATFNNI